MKIDLCRISPATWPANMKNMKDAYNAIMDFKERYLENPLENMHVKLKRNYITNTRLGLSLYITDDTLGLIFEDGYYCLRAKRVHSRDKVPPEMSVYKSIYKRHSGIRIQNNGWVSVTAYDPDMREARCIYPNDVPNYENFIESTVIAINKYIERKNEEYKKFIRKQTNAHRRSTSQSR